MPKITIVLLASIISVVLTACAGWEVGNAVAVTPSASVTSRTYVANVEVVNYSN